MTAELFIMVSAAAARDTERGWPAVAQRLRTEGRSFSFEVAQAPQAGTSFTRQALRAGTQQVVAVGDDQLIHEVVNGLYLGDELIQPEVVVGIVPFGSPSDVASGLGLRRGLAAVDTAVHGPVITVDLGRVTCRDVTGVPIVRYFVNLAEIGQGLRLGLGVRRSASLGQQLGGLLARLTPGLEPEQWTGTLIVDEGEPETVQALSVLVASGPLGQDGAELVPGAKMDDGQLDVLLVEPMGVTDLLLLLPQVKVGTHLEHPRLRRLHARQLTIGTPDWPWIELDGQREGAGGLEIAVLPSALRVRVGWP